VYTLLHTVVLFYHSVALNIALNSHNNMLITLLISNNFVELKSNVFKRCERENLFQIACADIVERFQLGVYLSIVGLQFIFVQKTEATSSEWGQLGVSFGLIFFSELTVDWIKHAVIIMFNRMSPRVYTTFIGIFCNDAKDHWTGSGRESAADDAAPSSAFEFTAPAASRMGFVPLPLLCLIVRVLGHDVVPRLYLGHPSGWLLCFLLWVVLCMLKVLTAITLLGYACTHAQDGDPNVGSMLNSIARYSLHGKRIV